jgi:hypothetical protein
LNEDNIKRIEQAQNKLKPKTNSKEIKKVERSWYEDTEYHYEQVYDCKTRLSKFARYNRKAGSIDYVNEIPINDAIIIPNTGEELEKGAVLLPSQTEHYETEEQLDNEIQCFINKWLDIPEDFKQFTLWNIKRSWIYQRFHTLNYLRALGDTGQGKSRFLDTLGYLHYKPLFTSGATTSSPVFRMIDKWGGSIIMDEADFQKTDESQEIIKIINQGYEKGKFIMRCDQNDARKVQFFDPFSPKVIATRKPFTDKAVESRCITQVMTGTKRKDIKFTLTEEFFSEAQSIRNKLLTWRFQNYYLIDPSINHDVGISDLEPRVQQVVSSYVAMFGTDQEAMEKFKTFIAEYQKDLIEERSNSFHGQVVKGIYDLFHEKGMLEISAYDIILQAELTDHKGEQMKPRALTNVLKELGFGKTKLVRVHDKVKRCIPMEVEHLKVVFQRYGLGNDVTVVTHVTGTSENQRNLLDKLEVSESDADRNNSYNRYNVTEEDLE